MYSIPPPSSIPPIIIRVTHSPAPPPPPRPTVARDHIVDTLKHFNYSDFLTRVAILVRIRNTLLRTIGERVRYQQSDKIEYEAIRQSFSLLDHYDRPTPSVDAWPYETVDQVCQRAMEWIPTATRAKLQVGYIHRSIRPSNDNQPGSELHFDTTIHIDLLDHRTRQCCLSNLKPSPNRAVPHTDMSESPGNSELNSPVNHISSPAPMLGVAVQYPMFTLMYEMVTPLRPFTCLVSSKVGDARQFINSELTRLGIPTHGWKLKLCNLHREPDTQVTTDSIITNLADDFLHDDWSIGPLILYEQTHIWVQSLSPIERPNTVNLIVRRVEGPMLRMVIDVNTTIKQLRNLVADRLDCPGSELHFSASSGKCSDEQLLSKLCATKDDQEATPSGKIVWKITMVRTKKFMLESTSTAIPIRYFNRDVIDAVHDAITEASYFQDGDRQVQNAKLKFLPFNKLVETLCKVTNIIGRAHAGVLSQMITGNAPKGNTWILPKDNSDKRRAVSENRYVEVDEDPLPVLPPITDIPTVLIVDDEPAQPRRKKQRINQRPQSITGSSKTVCDLTDEPISLINQPISKSKNQSAIDIEGSNSSDAIDISGETVISVNDIEGTNQLDAIDISGDPDPGAAPEIAPTQVLPVLPPILERFST